MALILPLFMRRGSWRLLISPLFISIHLPQLLYPSYEASWHGGRQIVPSKLTRFMQGIFYSDPTHRKPPGILAVQNTFNPFLPIVLCTGCYSCGLLRGTTFERNWSSSPLYAIHPGRTIVIQPVGFNSCSLQSELFKDRTGNIRRQVRGIVPHLSMRL